MAKNLENIVEIRNGNTNQAILELAAGKTVLFAVEKGAFVLDSIKKGFSDFFQANLELHSEGEKLGNCVCGKQANALVYLWR